MPELGNSIIIGGGLAGLATAYWVARQNPLRKVVVLEKSTGCLEWMKKSGQGAVVLGKSHADIDETNYPRGGLEANRSLQKWPGSATREWLSACGLVTEETPSGTFITRDPQEFRARFLEIIEETGVEILVNYAVESISVQPDGRFRIWTKDGHALEAETLTMATGGGRNHGLKLAGELGAEVVDPLPGYVRLRLASPKLGEQLGPMRRDVHIRCLKSGEAATGDLTLSARGLEGSVISELSSRLCVLWDQLKYRLRLEIDWLPDVSGAAIRNQLSSRSERGGRRLVAEDPQFGLSARQWAILIKGARIDPDVAWTRLRNKHIQALTQRIKGEVLTVSGMGLPRGERASAGGVDPVSMDAGTGESATTPGLFFAGEILDILGVPGGPQLNVAWGTAYQAGCSAGLFKP